MVLVWFGFMRICISVWCVYGHEYSCFGLADLTRLLVVWYGSMVWTA